MNTKALIGPAIEFGIPGAIAGVKILMSFIEKWNNDPNLSEAEFNKDWADMQKQLGPYTSGHEALRRQGK